MSWALLPLGMARECATQDCGGAATWELEVNDVGSCYCQSCKDAIDGQLEADRQDAFDRAL